MIHLPVMVIVVLTVLGLVLGSFVNALVWRLHEREELRDRALESGRKVGRQGLQSLSIMNGRSMCPHCRHELAAYDLVPVFSWLLLRGKCRYCKKPISWQYPVVEVVTALLFVVSYFWWPLAMVAVGLYLFVFWLIFLVGFMALAVYDLRWFILPNKIVLPLIGLAIVQLAGSIVFFNIGWQAIITAVWGIVIAAGIFYTIFLLSRGEWIGGGDVKLGVVLGILLGGPLRSMLMLFIASCLGTIVGLPFLIAGRRKMRIPFGPFLLIATVVAMLFGDSIISWYKALFIP